MDTLKAMLSLIGVAIAMRIALGILFYVPSERRMIDSSGILYLVYAQRKRTLVTLLIPAPPVSSNIASVWWHARAAF